MGLLRKTNSTRLKCFNRSSFWRSSAGVNTVFLVFGFSRPGIKPESTVLVADVLSTRSLIDFDYEEVAISNLLRCSA